MDESSTAYRLWYWTTWTKPWSLSLTIIILSEKNNFVQRFRSKKPNEVPESSHGNYKSFQYHRQQWSVKTVWRSRTTQGIAIINTVHSRGLWWSALMLYIISTRSSLMQFKLTIPQKPKLHHLKCCKNKNKMKRDFCILFLTFSYTSFYLYLLN